jgi:hypothetical protein
MSKEENYTMNKSYELFLEYSPHFFSNMFGSNVNITKLYKLLQAQLFKTPDNYLRASISKSFESIFDEALNPKSSNISQLKSEMKNTFKQLDMSNHGFGTYLSFMWHSSLPCFDIVNITAEKKGDSAILNMCYWKGQPMPCSAIFKKVKNVFSNQGIVSEQQ